jgi:uncharacterized SAM-binding protein YcdF (DUF218 family)
MPRARWIGAAAAAALAALVVLAALHAPILRAIGGWLSVEDRLERADAIVVLAGGTPFREATAAALLQEGWAPRIIISQPSMRPELRELLRLGIRPHDLQTEAKLALQTYGIRPEQIHAITEISRTTEPELGFVRDTAATLGYRRLILVTSPEHTRRVRMIWARQSRGGPEGIVVPARESFPFDDWWLRRRAMESVLHEYLGVLALTLGVSHLLR